MPWGTGNLVCGPTFAARYQVQVHRVSYKHTNLTHPKTTYLPELPPIHKQQRAVRLVVRRLELEAERGIRVARDVELERRHEEPHARAAAREARR